MYSVLGQEQQVNEAFCLPHLSNLAVKIPQTNMLWWFSHSNKGSLTTFPSTCDTFSYIWTDFLFLTTQCPLFSMSINIYILSKLDDVEQSIVIFQSIISKHINAFW